MAHLVSFVIASHKRAEYLDQCLASCIIQENIDKDIVIVLNPPDQKSEEIVQTYDARCVRTHRNVGAFPAKSLGIANARGDYIMVVDDDAKFLQTDDVWRLLQVLLYNPKVAAVTCNTLGPCEGPPISQSQEVPLFKDGFTLYRRTTFTDIAGFVPDVFFRAGGETYYANYIYDKGLSVVRRHDVTMFHAQTAIGRSRKDMNMFAVRNHALLVLLQEPARVIFFSLFWKFFTTALRIGIQRRDPASWLLGWISFTTLIPFGLLNRRPISWATYRHLRQMRRNDPELNRPNIKMTGEESCGN